MQGQVSAAVFRPSRLNFAGVCRWCGARWCDTPECVVAHEASVWAVCGVCWGGALDAPEVGERRRGAEGVLAAERQNDVYAACQHCDGGVWEVGAAFPAARLNGPYLPTVGATVVELGRQSRQVRRAA